MGMKMLAIRRWCDAAAADDDEEEEEDGDMIYYDGVSEAYTAYCIFK